MPRRNFYALATVFAGLWGAHLFVGRSLAQQPQQGKGSARQTSPPGQRTFTSTCAGCHGLDGRGGERGPNITGSVRLERLSDAQVSAIVRNGVPGTGMPPFRSLGASEVRAVVSYLRLLQGQNKAQPLPGNPARGREVFVAKAECSSCHMIHGQGGFLGADLSTFGSTRSAKEIRDVITDPKNREGAHGKTAVAVTRDGHRVTGLVRNEDNFSLQVLTARGEFYSLERSALESLEYQDHSPMPSDYGERLSPGELDDLVSYLMIIGRSAEPVRPVAREEE